MSRIDHAGRLALDEQRALAINAYRTHLMTPLADGQAAARHTDAKALLELTIHLTGSGQEAHPLAHWLADNPDAVYFWSDTHFGHANIIRYASRPFADTDIMDDTMAAAMHQLPQGARLVTLGDFSMGPADQGVKWWQSIPVPCGLIAGNHDVENRRRIDGYRQTAQWVDAVQAAYFEGQWLWFTHMPIRPHLLPVGVINVHGHIHDEWIDNPKYLNVSCEHWSYRPWPLSHLLANAKARLSPGQASADRYIPTSQG